MRILLRHCMPMLCACLHKDGAMEECRSRVAEPGIEHVNKDWADQIATTPMLSGKPARVLRSV